MADKESPAPAGCRTRQNPRVSTASIVSPLIAENLERIRVRIGVNLGAGFWAERLRVGSALC